MLGYKLLSEYYSEDDERSVKVWVDPAAKYYKVVYNDGSPYNLFKYFVTEEQAENEAENWIAKK